MVQLHNVKIAIFTILSSGLLRTTELVFRVVDHIYCLHFNTSNFLRESIQNTLAHVKTSSKNVKVLYLAVAVKMYISGQDSVTNLIGVLKLYSHSPVAYDGMSWSIHFISPDIRGDVGCCIHYSDTLHIIYSWNCIVTYQSYILLHI